MSKFKYDAKVILAEIPPYSFYQREVTVQDFGKNGWTNGGLCPFHADSKAGSFFVNLESGQFKCYSCGSGGSNIIAFTMQKYNLSFYEALKMLAEDWRVK